MLFTTNESLAGVGTIAGSTHDKDVYQERLTHKNEELIHEKQI